MVMGRDSRYEGRGFESRHHILEKTENKRKRGRGWPVFVKKEKRKTERERIR